MRATVLDGRISVCVRREVQVHPSITLLAAPARYRKCSQHAQTRRGRTQATHYGRLGLAPPLAMSLPAMHAARQGHSAAASVVTRCMSPAVVLKWRAAAHQPIPTPPRKKKKIKPSTVAPLQIPERHRAGDCCKFRGGDFSLPPGWRRAALYLPGDKEVEHHRRPNRTGGARKWNGWKPAAGMPAMTGQVAGREGGCGLASSVSIQAWPAGQPLGSWLPTLPASTSSRGAVSGPLLSCPRSRLLPPNNLVRYKKLSMPPTTA